MRLLSTGNIFLKMGKLIEFFETIARAGAFLPAGISHAKELSLVLESFTKLNILTGIYIKF